MFTATTGNTTVDITTWTLTNLTVTPPADSDVDFALTVTATATEIANGDQVSRVDSINVKVTAVADTADVDGAVDRDGRRGHDRARRSR